MLREIIIKELQKNVLRPPFWWLLGLSLVLFMSNAFFFSAEYHDRLERHQFMIDQSGGNAREIYGIVIPQKPSPLAFIVDSSQRFKPEGLRIEQLTDIEALWDEFRYGNFFLPVTESLDWVFIINVLFTIFAIIFTFDAITAEKTGKTLALVCSYSIFRLTIIIGKYLGAMITLLIPLGLGLLANLILLQILGTIDYSRSILVLVSVFLNAFGCVSVFTLIGLLFTTSSHQSLVSLLLSASSWIVLVLMVPDLSGVLAKQIANVPSEFQLKQELDQLRSQTESWRAKAPDEVFSEQELEEVKQMLNREFEQWLWQRARDEVKIQNRYRDKMRHKRRIEQQFKRVSPVALFQEIAEEITGNGLSQERQFYEQVVAYQKIVSDDVQDKIGEPVELHWGSAAIQMKYKGKEILVNASAGSKYWHVLEKLKDFPEFEPTLFIIGQGLKNALWKMALLIIWNGGLLFLAILRFRRYDVR